MRQLLCGVLVYLCVRTFFHSCCTHFILIYIYIYMHLCGLLLQDEFRQWFRAKVHVMFAPGKKPFDSLDLESTDQLLSKDGEHSVGAAQAVQVAQWETLIF